MKEPIMPGEILLEDADFRRFHEKADPPFWESIRAVEMPLTEVAELKHTDTPPLPQGGAAAFLLR